DKILALRIFSNDLGKFDFCLKDISGQLLIVSQFTLYANCAKGRRPDFLDAASYQEGKKLYEQFLDIIKTYKIKFETGEFGADMLVKIQNAGPVTIILDSDEI
ncbi:MAG: D-tyrosyl-tRNA(Tyr) deacylase, partial [Elusimicrobiota bacterium]|nr:D-tyrosyl-tRNA(Tyr) deacylase [Elusimicrobiota bacterium]